LHSEDLSRQTAGLKKTAARAAGIGKSPLRAILQRPIMIANTFRQGAQLFPGIPSARPTCGLNDLHLPDLSPANLSPAHRAFRPIGSRDTAESIAAMRAKHSLSPSIGTTHVQNPRAASGFISQRNAQNTPPKTPTDTNSSFSAPSASLREFSCLEIDLTQSRREHREEKTLSGKAFGPSPPFS
jgi:hypothetical protein